MWDRPEAMIRLADFLHLVAAGLVLYVVIYHAMRLPMFTLREVRLVEPVAHVTKAELAAVMRREVRGNFFTLDLARTRTALEELPWVRSANLRRRWPDGLDMALEEHVPLAQWGTSSLVSTHGEVFEGKYEGALPEFVGPPGAAKEMAIQYEHFRSRLAAIDRVPVRLRVSARRAWQIELDGGTILELGREHMEARLARFVAVYPHTLALLDRPVGYVDLRYANGFAVRVPPGHPAAPAKRKSDRT